MKFVSTEELHHAPGEGPFRVKGIVYTGALAHYDATVPGRFAAILERLDGPLAEFLKQPFLSASWYDVGPLIVAGKAAAVAAKLPYLDSMRVLARAQAERDIQGVYKLLLKVASPEMVMRRLPRAATKYFEFVRAEVRELKPRCWESVGHGVPSNALTAYMAVTEAFVTRALQLAGAQQLKHRWFSPIASGLCAGHTVMSVRRELSWE